MARATGFAEESSDSQSGSESEFEQTEDVNNSNQE